MSKKYEVFEGDLATQLGVPREMLSALRADLNLERGKHWRNGANGRIYLNQTGVKLLMERLEQVEREDGKSRAEESTPPVASQDASDSSRFAGAVDVSGTGAGVNTEEGEKTASEGNSGDFSRDRKTPPSAAEVVAAAAAVEPVVMELTVEACCRNPKIVLARADGLDGLQRVKVRSNANYAHGMRLRCRKSGLHPDLWLYEGRAPRWKGRW